MTDDTSPENLHKFLESDDPALIGMGLSMAKGSADSSGETLGMVLGLYLFHGDKNIRSLAKKTFTKLAPSGPKRIVREYWQAEFRNESWVWEEGWMQDMVSEIDEAGINPAYLLVRALRTDDDIPEFAARVLGEIGDERAVELLIGVLLNDNKSNRWYAARVLGEIGGERAVEPLIEALSYDEGGWYDYEVHEAAAEALGEIGDKRAVEPLIGLLDAGWKVSKAAAEALKKLGHEAK
ncbi:MAG TPA: HEAT repeat domain-containing protein [Candidatus Poseidoniales archaeon]|jgi:hypothetical protein|nr:HEAT repeat domain-containing protein [Candidatus Poseidoniales archaeon]